MQWVSQYSTANPTDPSRRNPNIWGFTEANPSSECLNRYHIRTGPVENPAATIRENGLFALHYSMSQQSSRWIQPMAGWR